MDYKNDVNKVSFRIGPSYRDIFQKHLSWDEFHQNHNRAQEKEMAG